MVFENFEFAGFEEGNFGWRLEIEGKVWRGRDKFLSAVGTDNVQADKLLGD